MPKETRLKQIRRQRGLQQREVAKYLGVSYQYYCEIENGRRPSFQLAIRLAHLLDTPIQILFPLEQFVHELQPLVPTQAQPDRSP